MSYAVAHWPEGYATFEPDMRSDYTTYRKDIDHPNVLWFTSRSEAEKWAKSRLGRTEWRIVGRRGKKGAVT